MMSFNDLCKKYKVNYIEMYFPYIKVYGNIANVTKEKFDSICEFLKWVSNKYVSVKRSGIKTLDLWKEFVKTQSNSNISKQAKFESKGKENTYWLLNNKYGFGNCGIQSTMKALGIEYKTASEQKKNEIVLFKLWKAKHMPYDEIVGSYKKWLETVKKNPVEAFQPQEQSEVSVKKNTTLEMCDKLVWLQKQLNDSQEAYNELVKSLESLKANAALEHKTIESERIRLIQDRHRTKVELMDATNNLKDLHKKYTDKSMEVTLLTSKVNDLHVFETFVSDLKKLFGINDLYALMQVIKGLKR